MATNSPEAKESNKNIQKAFESFGEAGVFSLLNSKLNGWKKEELNIAVVGNSGTGKSSFINTVRKLKPGDNGAAKVGVTQETRKAHPYCHPGHQKLVYWDLPGVGTPDFPHRTYLDDVDFEKYDFYIIVSSSRFTEHDQWLAKKVKGSEKGLIFLRSKIDIDLANEKRDHPKDFDEEAIIRRIRDDCTVNLKDQAVEANQVFVISNYHSDCWDFPAAVEKLVRDFPEQKQKSMILIIGSETEKLVRMKKEVLKGRVKLISLLSAFGGAVPVPGVSGVVNSALLYKEIKHYQKQFGLDDKTIKELHTASGMHKTVKAIVKVSAECIMDLIMKTPTNLGGEFTVKMIPIVGMTATAGMSYWLCSNMLNDVLDDYAEYAITIVRNRLTQRRN